MKQASAPASVAASPTKPAASKRRSVPPKPHASAATQPAVKARAKVRPAQGAITKPSKAEKPAASAAPSATAPIASAKPTKPPKIRLVRDSFTMPETDFALVAVLKARALGQGRAAKKSELLRAGLQLLSQQEPSTLLAALERLQPIKTGRPRQGD